MVSKKNRPAGPVGAPDSTRVSALAAEVISVLSDRPQPEPSALRASIVDQVLDAVIFHFSFDPVTLIANLRAKRISEKEIADLYVPEVARHLGCGWTNNELSFVDVTLGTMRLQSLMGELSANWDFANTNTAESRSVLLINCDGDRHTLGSVVVATQLRRQGAVVQQIFGASEEDCLDAVSHDTPDLILFSVSRPDTLAFVAGIVKKIRRELDNCPPIVVGGIVLEHDDNPKEKTGADFVTNDPQLAMRLCDADEGPSVQVAE